MPLRAAHVLLAVLFVHLVIGVIATFGTALPAPDFVRYYQIATAHGRPYVDYQVEHPIGTLALFKTIAAATQGRPSFALGVVCLNMVADGVIVAALLWGWGAAAAACFAIIVLPVLDLLFNRIDLWSTACATVAVAAWQRERPMVTASVAPLGAAFKLWPLLFLVLLLVPRDRQRSLRPLVTGALALTALAGAWLAVAGWRGFYEVLTFRGATGWQIESVVGSMLHLLDPRTLRLESGSWRIGRMPSGISIVMFAVAAPICLWSVWRGARANRIGAASLASTSSLLILSTLLSAQFVGWLVPGAAVAWAQGDRRLTRVAVLVVLLTGLFWRWYWAVLQTFVPLLVVVALRNIVLIVLAVMALRTLLGLPREQPGSVLEADL